MRAAFSLTIDGKTVTRNFAPLLISMTITDSDGGKSDSIEIELDDKDGQIALPRTGADLVAEIWWDVPPPWASSGSVRFEGKTDEPTSSGARGGGMTLSISAKSADHAGKGKGKQMRYKDDATFAEAAQEFGQASGYTVKVDATLGAVTRDYWHMANESFFAWGKRIAEDLGATFKVSGQVAVFVPRNGATSASGAALPVLNVSRGTNLINWHMSPALGRAKYKSAKVRHYDAKQAKWLEEVVEIDPTADADLVDTYKHSDAGRAQSRAQSNKADADRKKGGGSITIDGDAMARSQATCLLSGTRPGIDGSYRIKTAKHSLSRHGGWTVSCDLEQPSDAAGKDSRVKSTSTTSKPAAAPATNGTS